MITKYIFRYVNNLLRNNTTKNQLLTQYRNSSYQNSKLIGNVEEYTSNFEVTKDPNDWKYVERVIPPLIVPQPKNKPEYYSGWKPQTENVINEKYFVPRNKNFMIPVYLKISHRGMRKITKILRIQGDINELEKDLKIFLEMSAKKEIATQINEFVGYIHIKGDYVQLSKEFLLQKGF